MGYFSTTNRNKLPSVEKLIAMAKREHKANNMVHFAQTRAKVQEKLQVVRGEDTSRFAEPRRAQHDNVITKCEKLLLEMDEELAEVIPIESADGITTGKVHSKVLAAEPETVNT